MQAALNHNAPYNKLPIIYYIQTPNSKEPPAHAKTPVAAPTIALPCGHPVEINRTGRRGTFMRYCPRTAKTQWPSAPNSGRGSSVFYIRVTLGARGPERPHVGPSSHAADRRAGRIGPTERANSARR